MCVCVYAQCGFFIAFSALVRPRQLLELSAAPVSAGTRASERSLAGDLHPVKMEMSWRKAILSFVAELGFRGELWQLLA